VENRREGLIPPGLGRYLRMYRTRVTLPWRVCQFCTLLFAVSSSAQKLHNSGRGVIAPGANSGINAQSGDTGLGQAIALGLASGEPVEVRVKDGELEFCHLLHGVTHALASNAALFHAAIRHVIGAIGRDVVYDDASHFQLLDGV